MIDINCIGRSRWRFPHLWIRCSFSSLPPIKQWIEPNRINRVLVAGTSLVMKMKTFSLKSSPATSTSKPSNEAEAAENANIFGCYARTVNYRRFYLFQMICLPFIPIMALFFQNLTIFLEQINVYEETRNVNQEVSALITFRNFKPHS